MRLLIAALTIALMTASAQAQVGPNGMASGGSKIGNSVEKATSRDSGTGKPKADDKAYSAVLRNLPDKQYDPWHGVR